MQEKFLVVHYCGRWGWGKKFRTRIFAFPLRKVTIIVLLCCDVCAVTWPYWAVGPPTCNGTHKCGAMRRGAAQFAKTKNAGVWCGALPIGVVAPTPRGLGMCWAYVGRGRVKIFFANPS